MTQVKVGDKVKALGWHNPSKVEIVADEQRAREGKFPFYPESPVLVIFGEYPRYDEHWFSEDELEIMPS